MKILQLTPYYIPAYQYGGPIYSVHNLAKGLVEQGIDVEVWTTNLGIKGRKDIPLGEDVLIDGVKVYYFPIIGNFHYAFSPSMEQYLKKKIAKFDIVHIQGIYQFHSLIGGYYSRKFGVPYVVSPKGMLLPEVIRLKGRLKKKLYMALVENRNIINANLIHCTTKDEKEGLLKLGSPFQSTAVIPNSIETYTELKRKNNKAFRKKYNLIDKKIILFLSRLNWIKGIDKLIPSFSKVVKKYPKAHLVLAGPDERGYQKNIKKWIKKQQIEKYVTFTGLLKGKEKTEALYGSDLFILPSYSENFGMAVVEAMLAGLPIILTNNIGVWDIIKKNDCGIIVDLTPDSIAKGICYLLENPEQRKKMGRKAQEIAKREFSIKKVAKEMIEAYKEVL